MGPFVSYDYIVKRSPVIFFYRGKIDSRDHLFLLETDKYHRKIAVDFTIQRF